MKLRHPKLPQPIYEYLAQRQETVKEAEKHKWYLSDFARNTIVDALLEAQGQVCMYCESRISKKTGFHIEHIKERHEFSNLIYKATNFGLSCNGGVNKDIDEELELERLVRVPNMHCGHKKTKSMHNGEEIDEKLIINPYEEDMYALFYFIDELIVPRDGLSERDLARCVYTIKRLNLNSGKLKYARGLYLNALRDKLMSYKSSTAAKRFISTLLSEKQDKRVPYHSMIQQQTSYLR